MNFDTESTCSSFFQHRTRIDHDWEASSSNIASGNDLCCTSNREASAALCVMPSSVLNAFWANIAANNARRIEALKPRLDMPYINGAFDNQTDEQNAKGDTERTQKWPTHYLSAEEAI
ncbi:hypothetical protein CBER1_03143 [Cercospora berteroae]|uniref:Uncharacterized protein n=1 Tax=Cercospora berteroae TaxID=357750 RepID=A0A2S6CK68_9PEZI|nr:hypothetical protein CBER1_03143 [Cercospora berteroae]